MRLPVSQWPVTQDTHNSHDIEVEKIEISANVAVNEPSVFNFEALRCQSYQFMIKLVALVFKMARRKSLAHPELVVEDLTEAEAYIIKQSMSKTKEMFKKGHLKSLRAEEGTDGIIRLGSRALEGLRKCYDNDNFPILTYNNPIAFLWMKKVHRERDQEGSSGL